MASKILLADMLTYLKTQAIITDPAVDGFRDNFPDKPDNLVAVREYSGTPAFVTDTCNRSVQMLVRNLSYETARAKIYSIFNLFAKDEIEERYINFTSTRWGIVKCRQTPFHLRTDESGRVEFVFNMSVQTYPDE